MVRLDTIFLRVLRASSLGGGALAAAVLSGCGRPTANPPGAGNSALSAADSTVPATSTTESAVTFVDVTRESNIRFAQNTGGFGLKWLPEQLGSGVACFDFDSDGYPDLYFPNGRDWTDAEIADYRSGTGKPHARYINATMPRRPNPRRTLGALYRNNRDGTFADVTKGSGLEVEMYGIGVAAGDYDNDGQADLYVTGYNGNRLFRNLGGGKFRDVTQTTGVRDAGVDTLSTSAMWVDYDRDGKLDLFVCHYALWSPATDAYDGNATLKASSSPERYPAGLCRLFRNNGAGKFQDVSVKAGIRPDPTASRVEALELGSKALGIALCDFDNDLWPDLAVANDREPNFLFRNNHDGTFSNVADKAGIAVNTSGQARSGMGIDVADFDHSNREGLVIGNFTGEMLGLYQNQGNGLLVDIASASGIAAASEPFLTFGVVFTDVDNDGWPDIFLANGHVNDLIETARSDRTYAQRPLLFRNQGTAAKGTFREIGMQSGAPLSKPLVGRGLASADFDLDGDDDLVLTAIDSSPVLLRNDGGNKNHSLRITLRGTKSNRDANGAVVWAEAGGEGVRRRVHSGSSYISQSELPLTLGLGKETRANLTVRWPSGKLAQLGPVQADQSLLIDETKGIVRRQPLTQR
jgi:hypothetical protein